MNNEDSFCPSNKKEWREWLKKNHLSKNSVWLVLYKKGSEIDSISWSDAVDEALCFGWIDSVKKSIDNESYKQYYSKRKNKSNWSRVNKNKVNSLIEEGLMSEAGFKSIEIAKENGSWTILDSVEDLIIPDDLELELNRVPESKAFFSKQSKSIKKILLYWVISAKRPVTREKRIKEIVINAADGKKPKQF